MSITTPMRPGQVYRDKHGGIFIVTGCWTEPVVCMSQVWPPQMQDGPSGRGLMGGINGLMWDGYEYIGEAKHADPE